MNNRRTSMLKTATVTTFVVLLTACAASRAQALRDPTKLFESADTNGDGVITRAEFLAARAGNFAKYDRNGDGFIDKSDFPRRLLARAQASERLDALIDHFDTDHDGRISRSEFVDGPTSAFDLADTNGDGQLSKDEVADAAKVARERRDARAD